MFIAKFSNYLCSRSRLIAKYSRNPCLFNEFINNTVWKSIRIHRKRIRRIYSCHLPVSNCCIFSCRHFCKFSITPNGIITFFKVMCTVYIAYSKLYHIRNIKASISPCSMSQCICTFISKLSCILGLTNSNAIQNYPYNSVNIHSHASRQSLIYCTTKSTFCIIILHF